MPSGRTPPEAVFPDRYHQKGSASVALLHAVGTRASTPKLADSSSTSTSSISWRRRSRFESPRDSPISSSAGFVGNFVRTLRAWRRTRSRSTSNLLSSPLQLASTRQRPPLPQLLTLPLRISPLRVQQPSPTNSSWISSSGLCTISIDRGGRPFCALFVASRRVYWLVLRWQRSAAHWLSCSSQA